MDNKDIGLEIRAKQWELWRPGPASRTILQKITDTLEAAGITVSGIETWPPEEDGRVSVSMTIRPQPEPKSEQEYTDFDFCTFIETYLEYNNACWESVKTVYEKYINCGSPKPVKKLDEFLFIRHLLVG
jgi:hypothetical protein